VLPELGERRDRLVKRERLSLWRDKQGGRVEEGSRRDGEPSTKRKRRKGDFCRPKSACLALFPVFFCRFRLLFLACAFPVEKAFGKAFWGERNKLRTSEEGKASYKFRTMPWQRCDTSMKFPFPPAPGGVATLKLIGNKKDQCALIARTVDQLQQAS
jgi:hypothetical protein